MSCDLKVMFGEGHEYEFRLHDADLAGGNPQEARAWFDEQFVALGCEPVNPMGKTLIIDKILCVAQALGSRPFAENAEIAVQFAKSTARVLGRATVTVDVRGYSIGY